MVELFVFVLASICECVADAGEMCGFHLLFESRHEWTCKFESLPVKAPFC